MYLSYLEFRHGHNLLSQLEELSDKLWQTYSTQSICLFDNRKLETRDWS